MCSTPQAPLLSTNEFEVRPAGDNSVSGPKLSWAALGFVLCACALFVQNEEIRREERRCPTYIKRLSRPGDSRGHEVKRRAQEEDEERVLS